MTNKNFCKTTFLFFLLFALAIGGAGCGGESEPDESGDVGFVSSPIDLSHLKNNPPKYKFSGNGEVSLVDANGNITLPKSYSLLEHGRVTPVKNQAPYGTCWAFAALAACESNYLTKKLTSLGDVPDLSELHMAWFVYNDPDKGHSFSKKANHPIDNTGESHHAIAYMSRMAGPVIENNLPYNLTQNEKNTIDALKGKKPSDYRPVALRLLDTYLLGEVAEDNRDIIKQLIMEHGSVAISYNAGKGATSPEEGTVCYFNKDTEEESNHEVLLVGWDDNFDRGKFNEDEAKCPKENGAWFAKNSWGDSWPRGEGNGYFFISYEQWIKDAAVYIVGEYDNKITPYYHDALGQIYLLPCNWAANIFQAGDYEKENEAITSVSFWTLENNAKYEIYMFDLGTDKPLSPVPALLDEVECVAKGEQTFAGYHTIELAQPIPIGTSHYFSVVLKLVNPTIEHSMAAESENSSWGQSVVKAGESYFADCTNDILIPFVNEWVDGATASSPINACIKAFTTRIPKQPIDANDENDDPIDIGDYKTVTSTNTQWNASAYAVTDNVTISERIKVSGGTVQLVLCDGCTLNAEKGIEVPKGNTLVIRGQTQGTGTLKATSDNNAAIGGGGDITILGGTIIAENKNNGAGIGGNSYGDSGNIIIIGGNVTAKSAVGGAGIGGGSDGTGGKIIISGGTIIAEGGSYGQNYKVHGRGIGGGRNGSGGDIKLLGGVITARPGIGNGENSDIYGREKGILTIDGKVDYYWGSVYVKKEKITCNYHYFERGKCVWCGEISEEKIEINTNSFPDQKFRNYVLSTFDTNKDNSLSVDEITRITELDISNKNISSVKGIEYFTELTKLFCDNNKLTELNISNNKQLRYLSCQNNQLEKLDISKNSLWYLLDCSKNKLTQLDIRSHTDLKALNCSENQLTELDIRNNTELKELNCDYNQLTQLDVSHNTALQVLLCGNNSLTQLNVSNNSALKNLRCYYNKIKELDVDNNRALERLVCDDNQLTELDITNNTKLYFLWCAKNSLKNLDVTKNIALTVIDCSYNQLTQIDVSKNAKLQEFYCDYNRLTKLDLQNNTNLASVMCTNNSLTSLVLGKNRKLERLICEQNKLKGVDISGCPNLKDFGHDDWNTSSTQYTISYILNGGTNNADNPQFYTRESETITLKAPIKDGYIFNGWTYNGQVITQIKKGSTGNLTLTATWEVNQHNSHPEVSTIEIAVLERGLKTPASNYIGLLSQVIQDQYKDDSATPLNEKDISKISASLFSKTGFTADGNTRLMLRVQSDKPGSVNFYIPDEIKATIEKLSRSQQSSSSVTITAEKVDDNIYQATAILTAPSDYPAGMNFPSANFDISVKFRADDHTTSEKKITLSINATPVVFIHGIFGESASAFGKGENKGIWHILNEAGVKTYFWNYDNYRGPTDVIKEGVVSDLYKKLIAIFGEYNSRGIACTRADLIGHSMGGLMARRFTIADYGNKIGHVSYAQGAVRRIITVATPHRGSPWATHVLRNEAFKEFCEKLLGSGKDASSAWYDLYEPNSLKIGYNASVPIYSLCGNIRDFISLVADKVITYTGGTRAVLDSLSTKSYEDIAFIILASLIIKKQDRDKINNLTSDLENLINDNIFSGQEHDSSVSVPSATLDFTESYSEKYNGINYNHMTICKQDDVGRDVLNLLKAPKYTFKLFGANTASLASPQYKKKQISVSAIDDTDMDMNFEMLEKINMTLEPSTLKLTNSSSGSVTLNAVPSDEISSEVFVVIQNSDGNRIFAISPEANNNSFSVTMEFTNEVSGILNVFCFAAGKDGNLYVSGKKQLTILPALGNISRLEFLDSTGTIFTRVNSDIPAGVYAITNDGKTYDVSSPLMGTEFNIGDTDKISITDSGYIRGLKAGKTSLSAKFSGLIISTNVEISEETGDTNVPYTDDNTNESKEREENGEHENGKETGDTDVPYTDDNTHENEEREENDEQENSDKIGDGNTDVPYTDESTDENETSGGGGCNIGFWFGIALFVLLDFFIKYKFKI